MTTQWKKNQLVNYTQHSLINLPTVNNISYLWNFGSILFLMLMIQIVSGLMLASSYAPSIDSFYSTMQNMEMSNYFWTSRYIHSNGASFFFIFLYLHLLRGIYYKSYYLTYTWLAGMTILTLAMMTAFMGYVLPMNQMSYWAASVITNLFSELPYIGSNIVSMMWGSSTVSTPTINRFFMAHFIVPFVILALVMMHITFLHETGSSNPLGLPPSNNLLSFNHFFSFKDLLGFYMTIMILITITLMLPLYLGDHENFFESNQSVTPPHIKPEWYFLFAYAILRSIPNKLGGVIALLMSIIMFFMIPLYVKKKNEFQSLYFKLNFFLFSTTLIMLTWIGMNTVEPPYIILSQIFSIMYFSFFLILWLVN